MPVNKLRKDLVTPIDSNNNGAEALTGGTSTTPMKYVHPLVDLAGSVAGVSTFEGRSGAVVSANGDYTASEITNVPAGDIASTNSQAAVNELDQKKQADIQWQDEGSNEGAAGAVTTVNYVGAGVTAAESGGTLTVTIPSGGATNLTYTPSSTQGQVNSDTGTDAVIPLATTEGGTNVAGLMSPAEKSQITQQTVVYGATINANMSNGNIVYVSLTGDAAIAAPTNTVAGETITYILTATGANRTATFAATVFKEEDGSTDTGTQVITSGTTKVFQYKVGPTVLNRIGGTAATGSQTFTEDIISLAPVTINVERGGASAITGSTSSAGVYDIVIPTGSRPFGIKFSGANLNLRPDNALEIKVDNSANGYDLDFNSDITTTNNNTEISEFATGVNPNQTHSGNITIILFSGMNAFGSNGYTLRLK